MRRKASDIMAEWRKNPKEALLLRGPRQTGKTYLMKEFAKGYDVSLYLNFEDEPSLRSIFESSRDPDSIYLSLSVLKGFSVPVEGPRPLLMLDEVQVSEAVYSSLKPLAEDGRCNILASGSLLGVLMNSKFLSPMGYVRFLDVGPMDFEEFMWALGTDTETTERIRRMVADGSMPETVRRSVDSVFRRYVMVGGMPAAVSAFADTGDYNIVWERLGEIIEFARGDVMKYAPNALKLRILAVMDSIPRMLSRENKAYTYYEVENRDGYGSREYDPAIDWLIAAGIAVRCRNLRQVAYPLSENEDEKRFKIYMRDSGLLLRMYGRESASAIASGDFYVNSGAMAESIIAQSLLSSGFGLRYYSKEKSELELDFIIRYRGRLTAVEVKSGVKKRSRSLLNALKIQIVERGIKLADFKAETDENGVLHLPLSAPSFMESEEEIGLDLPDIESLNRMVGESE